MIVSGRPGSLHMMRRALTNKRRDVAHRAFIMDVESNSRVVKLIWRLEKGLARYKLTTVIVRNELMISRQI